MYNEMYKTKGFNTIMFKTDSVGLVCTTILHITIYMYAHTSIYMRVSYFILLKYNIIATFQ